MFRVRERSMSDTPREGWMNSDTLLGCVVSFVLSVGDICFPATQLGQKNPAISDR